MRPVTVTAGASPAASNVVPLDYRNAPATVALGVKISGTVTYLVEYTFDDVFDPAFNPGTANWRPHPTLSGSADADSNLAYPARGIRIRTTAGTGSATLTIVTAGI